MALNADFNIKVRFVLIKTHVLLSVVQTFGRF